MLNQNQYGVYRGRQMGAISPQGALISQCRFGGQHNLDRSFSSLLHAVSHYLSAKNYTVTHIPGISELNTPVSLDELSTREASCELLLLGNRGTGDEKVDG